MIYAMNTKTFHKIFSKEKLKHIEKTQFVVISKRIRKTSEMDAVVFAKDLYPPDIILADVRSSDKEFFKEKYFEYLDRYELKLKIALFIKATLEHNYPIMFICTECEWGLGFMQLLIEYIEDRFGFFVVDYKKFKLNKILPEVQNVGKHKFDYILGVCDDVIRESEKQHKKRLEKTEEGRRKLLKEMSTNEMIKKLKKMNLYSNGMSKSLMKDLLKDFYVRK